MAGRITIDNFSEELIEYMNKMGLTEEQVINIIKGNLTGDLEGLATNDKSSIVAAINELFQNANNGKELIANAIGEPLSSEQTFSAMSNDINGLLATFKTNMMNNGVAIDSGDRFKSLIDKIATMAEGGNKGIQFASGSYAITSTTSGGSTYYMAQGELSFKPTVLLVEYHAGTLGDSLLYFNEFTDASNYKIIRGGSFDTPITHLGGYITDNGFLLTIGAVSSLTAKQYYAIGVGEEDTTLLNSLKSILAEEGIVTTEEDDMASLITKVDTEFNEKNNEINTTRDVLANLLLESGFDITNEDDLNDLLTKLEGLIVIDSSASINGIVTKVTECTFKGVFDDYKEVVYLNHKLVGDIIFLVINGRKDLTQTMYVTTMVKYNLSTSTPEKIQQITQTNNGKYDSCYFLDDSVIFMYNLYEIAQYSLDTFTVIKSIFKNSIINTTANNVIKLLHGDYLFLFFHGYYRDASKIFRLNLTNMTIDKQYDFNAALINYGNALMDNSFMFIRDGYIYAGGYYSGTATGYIAKLSFELTLIEHSGSSSMTNYGLVYIYNNRINCLSFANYTDGVQLAVMTFDLGNNYAYNYAIYPTADIISVSGSNSFLNTNFIDGDENYFYMNYLGDVLKVSKNDFSIVAEYSVPSKDTIIDISNNEMLTISKDGMSRYKFYN